MVYKVQVMNEEEAERYNKRQNELDNLCDRIKICVCWSICILLFVYLIVIIILSYFQLKDNSNNLLIENGSQFQ